ncbi:MAG: phospholipase [Bacteroidetes bacterium]|nr:phospholipase [Bacteroidota bacterium]
MLAKNYSIALMLLLSCTLVNCQKHDEKTYRSYTSMVVDGRSRTYLVNLPPHYYDTAGFPLVIALHGLGGSASQFENDYHFSDKANASGFIAVYPEGVRSNGLLGIRTWNAGSCCDYAMYNNIDDVKFISQLLDKLIATYKINPKKVYVTGMSNGGMMAYRLACELSNRIAAIGVNSCTMTMTHPCEASRPVPILHIHSAVDTKVPPAGGYGLAGYYFPPVDSILRVWAVIDGCGAPPQSTTGNTGYTYTNWSPCSNGFSIDYYLTSDGGHAWPGGLPSGSWADPPSSEVNANDLIWSFFQRWQLP